jgi:hypothetical protein
MNAPTPLPRRDRIRPGPGLVGDPARPDLGMAGDRPVVLLPVRLETRFSGDARQLLVRIYPDDVHVDDHTPELTDAEVEAAARYWERVWRAGRGGTDAERAAFVELAGRVGVTRALWVAAATTPDDTHRPLAPVPEDVPLDDPPVLTAVPRAAGRFTRPAMARGLPDRWVVVGYRDGDEVVRHVGPPVPQTLQVGPSPDAEAVAADGAPAVEEGLRWLVDFDVAEAVGMGLRVPLGAQDAVSGFDRLLVVGVRTPGTRTGSDAGTVDGAAGELARLLDGHRYTHGLALLPPGAVTNNTDAGRTEWSAAVDPGWLFEQAAPAADLPPGAGAADAARALGLDAATLAGLPHGADRDQQDARAVHVALWPATIGYFVETLLAPLVDDADVEALREHFVEHVRGLGPLPTLRIGRQPYGLLPVTSLARFRPAPGHSPRHARYLGLLRNLVPEWLAVTRPGAGRAVPHVGRPGSDPDQELLAILRRDAVSGGYRLRGVRGDALARAVEPLLAGALEPAGGRLAEAVLELIGRPSVQPRIARFQFDPRSARVRRPVVTGAPLSETEPVPPLAGRPFNYLAWLAQRGERAGEPPSGPGADALLLTLARHSAALADADAAVRIGRPASVAARKAELEPELIDPLPQLATPTLARLLATPASTATGGLLPTRLPLGDIVATLTRRQVQGFGQPDVLAAFDRAQAVRAALGHLATVPSARLDRLVRAALDTCSHRLDAWVTSYATLRLAELRRAAPEGLHLGGYGWVENLRPKPRPRPVVSPPEGEPGPLFQDPTNAGFVLAPSLSHAATAAILLSGHLSHRAAGTTGGPLDIDLSSDRMRVALFLIEGIRQGQPLGALLGYRFERGLHEASRPGLELDAFIRPFRALAPLTAGQRAAIEETAEAVEAVAASNVVDGLALVRRLRGQGVEPALTGATPAQRHAILAELHRLEEAADALADLLVAESVHQAADGNLTRAAATLDALGSGDLPPPEPDVTRTPRPGFAVTHRLVTLAPDGDGPPPGWSDGAARPRRVAEPRLDRWAAAFLGPADRIRAAVRLVGGDGNGTARVVEVTVADLGVCALDLVYDAAGRPGDTIVEAWVVDHVVGALQPQDGTAGELVHPDDADWPGDQWPPDVLPLDDALELASWLHEVVTGARPLDAGDLAAPSSHQPDTRGGADRQVLAVRLAAVRNDLAQAVAQLEDGLQAADAGPGPGAMAALRAALARLAGFGLPGTRDGARRASGLAADDPAGDGRSVVAAAQAVATAARAALAIAAGDEGTAPAGGGAPPEITRLRAILGEDFIVLPPCDLPPGWAQALTDARQPAFLEADPTAPLAWLQQVGRVRERAGTFLLALTGGGRTADPLVAVQVPSAERWVALPLPPGTQPPPTATSLVVHASSVPDTGPVAGLVIDDWVEVIPSPSITAGLAFHADEPGARAPQAILLAVHPVPGEAWTFDVLVDVVSETADLARMRAVGPGEAPWLGRFLPALYLADNDAGDTIRIDPLTLVRP